VVVMNRRVPSERELDPDHAFVASGEAEARSPKDRLVGLARARVAAMSWVSWDCPAVSAWASALTHQVDVRHAVRDP